MSQDLDTVDARILDIIQRDASLSVAEIAERVGLSSSPCWRRIKRMEESGFIRGRVTLIDNRALGLDFEVIASVKLSLPSRANLEAFEAMTQNWPEVMECMTVTGAVDYMMHVVTTDMHAYDNFLRDKLLGRAPQARSARLTIPRHSGDKPARGRAPRRSARYGAGSPRSAATMRPGADRLASLRQAKPRAHRFRYLLPWQGAASP